MTEEQKKMAVELGQATARYIEEVMQNAIRQAMNDGVPMTDTEEMRKRILEAREKALQGRA